VAAVRGPGWRVRGLGPSSGQRGPGVPSFGRLQQIRSRGDGGVSRREYRSGGRHRRGQRRASPQDYDGSGLEETLRGGAAAWAGHWRLCCGAAALRSRQEFGLWQIENVAKGCARVEEQGGKLDEQIRWHCERLVLIAKDAIETVTGTTLHRFCCNTLCVSIWDDLGDISKAGERKNCT